MATTRTARSAKKSVAKSSKKTSTRAGAPRKTATGRKKSAIGRKKATGRKKAAGPKYSRAASDNVGEELHEMKRGRLRSGGSGKKVTNRKQAIAIGLSEARRSGKKAPPNPNDGS